MTPQKSNHIILSEKLLRKIQQIVSPLSEEADLFISSIRQEKFGKGEAIIQEGQICNDIYFVAKGLLRTFLHIDGGQVNTEFFFDGEFAGAFTSFSLQRTTHLNMETLEDTTLLVISRSVLEKMYAIDSKWLGLGKYIFEKEFIKKCERESSFLQDNAKQRYLKLLTQYPLIEQRVPLGHIATYLGIQPETLSRIRSGKL